MIIKYKKNNWINIILTAILYSDNSKKKLITKSNNSLLKIINNNFKLTIANYNDILREFKSNKKFLKYYLFLPKFLKKLDMSYITLDYYKNNFYLNLNENLSYNKDYIKFNFDSNIDISLSANNPDYIIINLWNGDYENSSYAKNIKLICKYMPHLESKFNFKNYNIKSSGLSKYNNEIIFNNDNYKLDSCIFENKSEIMTGITYNNQKYIYKINNDNKSKFIKYDWDIIHKNGYKTLIYIKTSNNKNKINAKQIMQKISSKPLKHYIKLIKEEIQITEDKEKYKQLKYFYKALKQMKTTKEGMIKMTKEGIIKKIKEQYPYYVNLNKYKIDELKKIFNRDCNNIYLYYDGNNSCYIDSLLVSLFKCISLIF